MSDLTDNLFYWTTVRNIATDQLTEDADLGKKNHLFRWSSFWSWRVCKQPELLHLGHRKSARINWNSNAPKTSHCFLFWIVFQRHNCAIFLRKWARERPLQAMAIVIDCYQHYGATCHTAEAIIDVLRSVFEDRIISHRADVVWPTLSYH